MLKEEDFNTTLAHTGYRDRITLSNGNLRYILHKDSFFDQGFMHPFYLFEELTDEIRQAEKEAYGKVIRMMAHEVYLNHPLY